MYLIHTLGWSNVSSSLTQRIRFMKLKAKLLQELERALDGCQVAMVEYRSCVSAPLPPSPLLEASHVQLMDEIVRDTPTVVHTL